MTWAQILTHWPAVVTDFAAIYGVDLSQPDAWRGPAAPFRLQILALLTLPDSSLRRAIGGD